MLKINTKKRKRKEINGGCIPFSCGCFRVPFPCVCQSYMRPADATNHKHSLHDFTLLYYIDVSLLVAHSDSPNGGGLAESEGQVSV